MQLQKQSTHFYPHAGVSVWQIHLFLLLLHNLFSPVLAINAYFLIATFQKVFSILKPFLPYTVYTNTHTLDNNDVITLLKMKNYTLKNLTKYW